MIVCIVFVKGEGVGVSFWATDCLLIALLCGDLNRNSTVMVRAVPIGWRVGIKLQNVFLLFGGNMQFAPGLSLYGDVFARFRSLCGCIFDWQPNVSVSRPYIIQCATPGDKFPNSVFSVEHRPCALDRARRSTHLSLDKIFPTIRLVMPSLSQQCSFSRKLGLKKVITQGVRGYVDTLVQL